MPTHHFTLIVDGADLQDESVVNSLFESGCDDALVGSTDGVQFIDFDRDAASLKAAVQSAVADAERVEGIRVLRVANAGLTAMEDIAARTSNHVPGDDQARGGPGGEAKRPPESVDRSTNMPGTFSYRHGFQAVEREITIRQDAPHELREAMCPLARRASMTYSEIRSVVCDALLASPDPSNWSEEPNVRDEVIEHLRSCDWFKVYDIAEALYAHLKPRQMHDSFARQLNQLFREQGIGWEMDHQGKIHYRGSDAFNHTTKETVAVLQDSGRSYAAKEITEALADISRRPEPDITGAVHHAMAALEATARDITGEPKSTLGQLIRPLNLKPPLNQAMGNLWGYASNEARHGSENSSLDELEAELIVLVASGICTFLAKSHSRTR